MNENIFVANVENVRRPPLGEYLKTFSPVLVNLQQASRMDHDWKDYMTTKASGSEEGRGIKTLVRDDAKIIKTKTMKMHMEWTGPKAGKRHDPREYLLHLIEVEELRFWNVNVHLPTHNELEAQAESLRRLRRWANRHLLHPLFIGGDFNMPEDDVEEWSRRLKATRHVLGSVDYAVTRGLEIKRVDRRLAPLGPFHGWGNVKFAA